MALMGESEGRGGAKRGGGVERGSAAARRGHHSDDAIHFGNEKKRSMLGFIKVLTILMFEDDLFPLVGYDR